METPGKAAGLPRRIRALIYDFDNTIVGTARVNEELFRRSFTRRKPPIATGLDLMLALPVPQAIVTGSSREEWRWS